MRKPGAYRAYTIGLVRPKGPYNGLLEEELEYFLSHTPFLFYVEDRWTWTVCLRCRRNPFTTARIDVKNHKAFETYVAKHKEAGCFDSIAETRAMTRTTLADILGGTLAPMRVLWKSLTGSAAAPESAPAPAAPATNHSPRNTLVDAASTETKGLCLLTKNIIATINTLYGNDDVADALKAAETPEEYNAELVDFLRRVLRAALEDKGAK
jgi:hypothetical protein